MAADSSLVFAGIAPHPPIMVPEVGHEAAAEVHNSVSAMAELTQRVIQSGAETVVLISPHAPLEAEAFVAYDGPAVQGDFSQFRAPEATVAAPVDDELLTEITRAAENRNLITLRVRRAALDHGTAVPLYFLQRNRWSGKVVALGYSFLSNEDHLRFGNCIRQAIAIVRRPVAFIASGDLSHRLKPGAPAGFNPEAHLFDEEVVEAIRSGELNRIANMDQDLRRAAGECGYRSMLVALGVAEGSDPGCEVLSYEGPFGVGYLVAQLMSQPPALAGGPTARVESQTASDLSAAIPALARRTIERFVRDGDVITPPDHLPNELSARAGCFVSIKTRAGDLRGCIGTVDPAKDTLAEEIITNAISAATRDPRFPPLRDDELWDLKYSVDVLSAPEPCTLSDLDPKNYGVIVEDEYGKRRGLLLPGLEGIDTPAQQVEIAARKAGLAPGATVRLSRFRSERYSE
jgi:AmmeMemoRadiSam system protein A/AmmeMemoRadiSam system protein B